MRTSIEVGMVLSVEPHKDSYNQSITVNLQEEGHDGVARLYLPYELALELASKIESTYQGIVGPAEPETAIQKNGQAAVDPLPPGSKRCAFVYSLTGKRCRRQGTLGPGKVAYFCEEHYPRGGSCPH